MIVAKGPWVAAFFLSPNGCPLKHHTQSSSSQPSSPKTRSPPHVAAAAAHIARARMDTVEIHGAHGYLLLKFLLSSPSNKKIFTAPGYQVPFAERIKRAVRGLAVVAVRTILDGPQVEEVLKNDKAEFVATGRIFLETHQLCVEYCYGVECSRRRRSHGSALAVLAVVYLFLYGCRIPKTSDNNLYIRSGTKSTTSLTVPHEITIVMGIRGLPKELHESGGVAGVSCKEEGKSTHVDFLCRFFRLLQARAFQILQQRVKTGSNSVTETPAPELQLETEVTARSRKRKNIAEHNPSSNTPSLDVTIPFDAKRTLDELIEDSIERLGYKKLFLNPDGLSPVDMKNQQVTHESVYIHFV
ncbi:hypothetical protein K457DRAFT_23357 [Linnemannia elongata AG-77]|uniref:Uncharacterized protein n=1 Tax=Linnemannia elongata AG-77 TaxID=1314771 RepID=A0A197JLM0_9FUNG|nr:hypothetical protein K457DRAFT_23357 [Linnemannia elongata AG-77]